MMGSSWHRQTVVTGACFCLLRPTQQCYGPALLWDGLVACDVLFRTSLSSLYLKDNKYLNGSEIYLGGFIRILVGLVDLRRLKCSYFL